MYYIKIPLRHLVKPEQINVPAEQQYSVWRQHVRSLLQDIRGGVIPSWAIDYRDLKAVKVQEDVE